MTFVDGNGGACTRTLQTTASAADIKKENDMTAAARVEMTGLRTTRLVK